jgi:biotin transport system ATP-binding protein
MKQKILTVENLCFSFNKDKQILNNINFSIEEGSLCIIAGANGSGKSVLLKCIKGLLKPKEGLIKIKDIDVSKNTKERRKKIGLVFQDADSQIVGQTVEKDILFGLENIKIGESEKEERLNKVIQLLSLEDKLKTKPRELSGGEKRRLAIAGILAMNPNIIFLDEPFANLDYPGVVKVIKTLLLLQKEGHTIIIVSHEIDKIAAHSQKIILLKDGEVLKEGNSKEMLPHLRENGVYVPILNNKVANIEELTWLNL